MPRVRKSAAQNRAEPFWLLGLYSRLSKEDDNASAPLATSVSAAPASASVINQEKILRDFAAQYFQPGTYKIAGVFIDDGLPGTDTDRPSFNRLKKRVEDKEINCVIIKSLARGFRNLADQSKFLEEFLPSHGARFISIGNPFIDTYADPRSAGGFEVPIRGIFNEQFAAATSDEIRRTFKMKRERGEFIGSFAPYGYRKNPQNKNALLIDEDAAEVVCNIFNWFVNEGHGKRSIAARLNQTGEPNPEAYKRRKGLKYQNPNSKNNDGLWTSGTIHKILQNAVYTGAMVQGKSRVISYKVHKQVAVPEDEWFVVPGTHEAIVGSELFEKAQSLNKRDTRTAPEKGTVHKFSGFVRCADCKKAMHRKTARGITYFHCRTYADKKTCSKHTIRQDKLENAALFAIQTLIGLADGLPEEIERIKKLPAVRREPARLLRSLARVEKQLEQYTRASDSLYMDWRGGEISKDEYRRLKEKIAEQTRLLEKNIAYLKNEAETASGDGTDDPYLAEFLKRGNIQELNRGIIVALVETIWVRADGGIIIDFNFTG